MSINHSKFMTRLITFDDSTTFKNRWKKDKSSAFTEVFKMFEKQCARDYSPDGFLAIDEILYATRGSIGFKTYDKGKLIKYSS